MSIDKKIDYVEQDGSLNFIKNSKSVTVPEKFKARKNAPTVKLAYITDAEAKMLKQNKPGTPHKGPKDIPSYDSFGSIDASGKDTGRAGEDVSSAERGDFRGFEGSRNLPPGVQPKPSEEAQALRNQFIAAGGGQRVNPGFFDSRNVVSPAELARAKAFNPRAFSKGRNQGLFSFLGSGGIFGNLLRGIGQKLGLGKRFDEPTYDMSRFSNLGLFSPSVNPTYYNDLGNEGLLSLTKNISTTDDSEIEKQYGEYLMDAPPNPLTLEQFKNALEGIKEGTLPNTSTSMFTVPNAADLIIPVGDTGSALTTPVEGLFGLNLIDTRTLQRGGYTDSQIKEAVDGGYAEELASSMRGQLGV